MNALSSRRYRPWSWGPEPGFCSCKREDLIRTGIKWSYGTFCSRKNEQIDLLRFAEVANSRVLGFCTKFKAGSCIIERIKSLAVF